MYTAQAVIIDAQPLLYNDVLHSDVNRAVAARPKKSSRDSRVSGECERQQGDCRRHFDDRTEHVAGDSTDASARVPDHESSQAEGYDLPYEPPRDRCTDEHGERRSDTEIRND